MQIMGIVNVNVDSFYAGSRATGDAAVEKALQFAEEGAGIIDIGGESTRPGSEPISADEEIKHVLPVIEALVDSINAKISVDTHKPEVAEKAIESGADIINDITGMQNPHMRQLAADAGVEVVIMHMQGTPKTMQANPKYSDVVAEIKTFLKNQIVLCENDGIASHKIVIDPGIGFGKTTQHNLEILRNIDAFKSLGKRLLIGASRKSFIGRILGSEANPVPPEERLEASLAIAAYCSLKGVDILRVHDVKETLRVVKMAGMLK